MTMLGEFLGALVTEFTMGRVSADLAAARVAQMYRDNTLLEGAPVPRFRLPELSLEVPFAIDGVSEADDVLAKRYERPGIPESSAMLDHALIEAPVELAESDRARVNQGMFDSLEQHWAAPLTFESAVAAALQISVAVTKVLREVVKQSDPESGVDSQSNVAPGAAKSSGEDMFQRSLSTQLQQFLIAPQRERSQVKVIIRTVQLRELSEGAVLCRMNLTLREDGLDIVKIDRADGSRVERLVPE